MIEKILVVAAHPDDEWLGCGGTILKHLENGKEVHTLFICDGFSARTEKNKNGSRNKKTIELMNKIGAETPVFLDFPDNKLDSINRLDVIKEIEKVKENIDPVKVYTHYLFDMNIDHRIVSESVHTAFRPIPESSCKSIFQFEVLSSTEWSFDKIFSPNMHSDISDFIDLKIEYLKYYEEEMRSAPHTRSIENVKNLSRYRGNSVGFDYAESFVISRLLT